MIPSIYVMSAIVQVLVREIALSCIFINVNAYNSEYVIQFDSEFCKIEYRFVGLNAVLKNEYAFIQTLSYICIEWTSLFMVETSHGLNI